ncbi:MAG: hypothetical protein JO329_11620 [Planctomycetaceae bacterium]|nr:hypothetical protein [Planctomycetaceae bacterium]
MRCCLTPTSALQISLQEPRALVKAPGDLREQVRDFLQCYLSATDDLRAAVGSVLLSMAE